MPLYAYMPLPYFSAFTAYTAEIPKLYFDVDSQEQRIFELCKEYHKLTCYVDVMAERINSLSQDVETTLNEFRTEITEQIAEQNKAIAEQLAAQNAHVAQELENMRKYIDQKFEDLAEGQLMWDVTTGRYRPSKEAARRLYSALAYDHTGERAIVEDIAQNQTVAQMAQETVYHTAYSARRDIIIDDQLTDTEKDL